MFLLLVVAPLTSFLAITLLSSFVQWNLSTTPADRLPTRETSSTLPGKQLMGWSPASSPGSPFSLQGHHIISLQAFTVSTPTRKLIPYPCHTQEVHNLSLLLSRLTSVYKIGGKCSPIPISTRRNLLAPLLVQMGAIWCWMDWKCTCTSLWDFLLAAGAHTTPTHLCGKRYTLHRKSKKPKYRVCAFLIQFCV